MYKITSASAMTTPGDSEHSIEVARQLTALEGAVKAILDEVREGKLSKTMASIKAEILECSGRPDRSVGARKHKRLRPVGAASSGRVGPRWVHFDPRVQ